MKKNTRIIEENRSPKRPSFQRMEFDFLLAISTTTRHIRYLWAPQPSKCLENLQEYTSFPSTYSTHLNGDFPNQRADRGSLPGEPWHEGLNPNWRQGVLTEIECSSSMSRESVLLQCAIMNSTDIFQSSPFP